MEETVHKLVKTLRLSPNFRKLVFNIEVRFSFAYYGVCMML